MEHGSYILAPLHKRLIINPNEIQLQTHYQKKKKKKSTDHKVPTALPVWEQRETRHGLPNVKMTEILE